MLTLTLPNPYDNVYRSPLESVKGQGQGPSDNLANRTLGNLNNLEKAYLEEYLELKVINLTLT